MEAKDLCDCFKALIQTGAVAVYSLQGELTHTVMPHIPETRYRYNNCPCCGLEVRNWSLTREEFENLKP